jgi:predicted nucleic acid-binding protein
VIEKEKLYGKGFSLVDALILASAKKSDALIFSLEKKLNNFC